MKHILQDILLIFTITVICVLAALLIAEIGNSASYRDLQS